MAKPKVTSKKARKTVRQSVKRSKITTPPSPQLYSVWDADDMVNIGEDVIGKVAVTRAEASDAIAEYIAQNDANDEDWQRRISVYAVTPVRVGIITETKAEVSWPVSN